MILASGSGAPWLLTLILIALYFVPTIVAVRREHHNRTAIILVNVLLGWSIIGWIVALVWAMTNPPPAVAARESKD